MGYHAACLIWYLRCLEENGGTLRPQVFLTDEDADRRSEDGQAAGEAHAEGTHFEGGGGGGERSGEGEGKGNAMRAQACKHAKRMLETFLEMPAAQTDAVTTCLGLCVAYCALVLAHYKESQSRVADQVSLDLITRVENWARTAPGKAWSFKYGELAKRKVEARISRAQGTAAAGSSRARPGGGGGGGSGGTRPAFQGDDESTPGQLHRRGNALDEANLEEPHAGLGQTAAGGGYDVGEWASPGQSFDSATVTPGFEQNPFPSLGYFFGGGFYDFTR